ncbi:MAG: response regulator [Nanoarchaeota archaeon]|nr:response regulator [Nanoarchaeota archaeon]
MEKQQKPLDILVIDDEEGVRLSLKYLIKPQGHNITFVKECGEAIRNYIGKNHYHLILSDLNQNPSGVDVINAAKPLGIEVYIVTATSHGPLAEEAKNLNGEDHFIIKPFEKDTILNILSKTSKRYQE